VSRLEWLFALALGAAFLTAFLWRVGFRFGLG